MGARAATGLSRQEDDIVYGMVNQAIQDMVRSRFGDGTWSAITAKAGIDTPGFVSMRTYPDEITYRLVGAASEVLDTPASEILRAFGEYWILETAQHGYGPFMKMCGSTLPQFLRGLDQMHTRVSLTFPDMQPPSFTVTDETDRSLVLHYHSSRAGLTEFIVGLVTGLAKWLNTDARVHVIARREDGADHDQFQVTFG